GKPFQDNTSITGLADWFWQPSCIASRLMTHLEAHAATQRINDDVALHVPARAEQHSSGARNTYDHRIRRIYVASRDDSMLEEFGIPRSTANSWLARPSPEVVSFHDDPSRTE